MVIESMRRISPDAAERARPPVQPAVARPPAETAGEPTFTAGQAQLRQFGAPAGAAIFALFGRDRDPDLAGPTNPNDPGVAVNGSTYHVGPYEKPEIQHDNGFLQNPDDRYDPVPLPTREPTREETAYYNSEVLKAEGGGLIAKIPFAEKIDSRFALDNALPAYQHFLTGNGADREFDYGAYLRDDATGQQTLENSLAGVRNGADQLYGTLDQQVGQNPGDSVTFEVQSDTSQAVYPDSEDWEKTIGGHTQWSQSTVTVTRQEDGSLQATAEVTLHAEDRYNFNPGQADIETGVPDSERGVLEETGLAHQYTQTGQAEYTTTWTIGQPGSPGETSEGHSR